MKELKELEELGAVIEVTSNGLKLIGDWVDEYKPYHLLFTEITGHLNTYDTKQNKDFLRNLNSLGYLYTSDIILDKNFLRNLTELGYLDTSYTKQDKDFLRNLTHLGYLDTSNTKQDENFLRNLNSLGKLDTYNTKQDKKFLRNVSYDFKEPYIYADGILSIIHSKKVIDDITIYVTNRIGYIETEYIASDGNYYAHAKSIKLALLDLRFKKSNRDTSWLEDKSLEDIV